MVRKTGARALRSIVEEFMLDIMFDLPNKENVDKCVITRDVVDNGAEPIYLEDRKSA
jgi:ATP-dependent Clp protease ATP-binding subunit ClpX